MKYIIIIVGVIGVIALLVFVIFSATGKFTQIFNNFISEIKNENYKSAYDMASDEFKNSVNYENFVEYINNHGVKELKEFTWNSRSITNIEGRIIGFALNNSGEKVPMEVAFVKNNGEWKIISLNIKTGLNLTTLKKPTDKEMSEIVLKDINEYKNALISKDSSGFYKNNISGIWKSETTNESLDKILFKPFWDELENIEFAGDFKNFILSKETTISENGVLEVQGYFGEKLNYKGEDSVLHILNKYIKENGEWKLVGINVKFY